MIFFKICKTVSTIANRCYCSKQIMKYLNVAEKNDAAKNIAAILSSGGSTRREGRSKYNKIYEWHGQMNGQGAKMIMTSVSGHLLNYAFTGVSRSWHSCDPIDLFEAQVSKECPKDYLNIKKTLESEVQSCQGLIIWTDCDREGENIGFEVIEVCKAVRSNLRVFRAVFSEITTTSIQRALQNLQQPNKNVSDAVDVRQEIDLRTGAAFTRLQTLRLQRSFPRNLENKLISYGSCQFPTLGFVVDRYKEIENFIPEVFWKIKMAHRKSPITTDFLWERERLFERCACAAIFEICQESSMADVVAVDSRPRNKWRPTPLDTIELEKTASRKLRINAKEVMKIAEKLYTQGYISYPRTETDIFPKELQLVPLVEMQRNDTRWGTFAERILTTYGGPSPRQGRKSDHAHPPIHPTKPNAQLQGNEAKVYEFIVRRFLACVSKDAEGHETSVKVTLGAESFSAKGLLVLQRHFLDVYVYDTWGDKAIGNYARGERFKPTKLEMIEGSTTAPNLLTEADLITLMDRHGIGTDATQADHIETIKQREYVALRDNGRHFVPGTLGMGLVEGYNEIGLQVSLAKPQLRAEFERDLKAICDGQKRAEDVRREQINVYKDVFRQVAQRIARLDAMVGSRLGVPDDPNNGPSFAQGGPGNNPGGGPGGGSGRGPGRGSGNGPAGGSGRGPAGGSGRGPAGGSGRGPAGGSGRGPAGGSGRGPGGGFDRGHGRGFGRGPSGGSDRGPGKGGGSESEPGGNHSDDSDNNFQARASNRRIRSPPLNEWPSAPNGDATSVVMQRSSTNKQSLSSTDSRNKTSYKARSSSALNNRSFCSTSNCINNGYTYPSENSSILSSIKEIKNEMPNYDSDINTLKSDQMSITKQSIGNVISMCTPPGKNGLLPIFDQSQPNTSRNMLPKAPESNDPADLFVIDSKPIDKFDNLGNLMEFLPPLPIEYQCMSDSLGQVVFALHNQEVVLRARTDYDDQVVCDCGHPAQMLAVRKEGPNQGRQFYKCGGGGHCDMFLWESGDIDTGKVAVVAPTGDVDVMDRSNSQGLRCNCYQEATLRTVSKTGPNTGRQFYGCPNPMGKGCKFFQWADEMDVMVAGPNASRETRGRSRGSGRGGWRGRDAKRTTKTDARGKSKCSNCHQQGHTKKTCKN